MEQAVKIREDSTGTFYTYREHAIENSATLGWGVTINARRRTMPNMKLCREAVDLELIRLKRAA